MAQSDDYTPIKLYSSETADELPAAGKLEVGEVAVNIADAKLYTKNSSEEIVELSGGNNHMHTASQITDIASEVSEQIQIGLRPTVSPVTASGITLSLADESTIFLAAGALNLTVPKNITVPLPVGYIIHVYQMGSGKVTIVPVDADVSVVSAETLKTRRQYAALTLTKIASPDSWVVVGDQEAFV